MQIGEFEYMVLSAAARLDKDAYGASVRHEIEGFTRRRCSLGALYTTLDRLEAKGFIGTWMGEPTPERGGRPKRMVRLTPKGKRAASEFYETVVRATRGVSWELDRLKVRP